MKKGSSGGGGVRYCCGGRKGTFPGNPSWKSFIKMAQHRRCPREPVPRGADGQPAKVRGLDQAAPRSSP